MKTGLWIFPGLLLAVLTIVSVFAGQALAYHETDTNTWMGLNSGAAGAAGGNNTFYGFNTGTYTTTGVGNTFIGRHAGYANTSGDYNTFLGADAGQFNTNYIDANKHLGNNNTFLGYSAGGANTSGNYNTFVGSLAGLNNSTVNNNNHDTGNGNTHIGADAGHDNIVGNNNTSIGVAAGFSALGSNNVFLGSKAGFSEEGSNRLYIDNCYWSQNPFAPCDAPLIYGEFDNRTVKINGNLVMASDGRLKKNIEPLKASLEKVMKLQGVSFEWKLSGKAAKGSAGGREIGLIAQDVETVLPELVHTDGKGQKALSYDKMVSVLVEAIKEQQAIIREQGTKIQEKDARIRRLETALERLEQRVVAVEGKRPALASK